MRVGAYVPVVTPSWWFYGRGLLGLGAVDSDVFPEGTQFWVNITAGGSEVRRGDIELKLSRRGINVQSWPAPDHRTDSMEYVYRSRVKIQRNMSFGGVHDAVLAAFREAGGRAGDSTLAPAYGARPVGGSPPEARPSAPSPSETRPPRIETSAACRARGGVCRDINAHPVQANEAIVRGICSGPANVVCVVSRASAPAPSGDGTRRPSGETRPPGGTRPPPGGRDAGAAAPPVWGGAGGEEVDWGKVVLWGGVAAIGLTGVLLIARYFKQKRAAKSLQAAGARTPHRTVVDFGPSGARLAANRRKARRRNAGPFSVWMRRQGSKRWQTVGNLAVGEADEVFRTFRDEPRLAELMVASTRTGETFRHFKA